MEKFDELREDIEPDTDMASLLWWGRRAWFFREECLLLDTSVCDGLFPLPSVVLVLNDNNDPLKPEFNPGMLSALDIMEF